MLIDLVENRVFSEKTNRWSTQKSCILKCDACQIQFERPQRHRLLNKEKHYCSIRCVNDMQQQGKLIAKSFCDPENVKLGALKAKTTNIERYGGCGFASETTSEKARQTMLSLYGSSFPQELESTKEKMKETNRQRWGHSCTVHSDELYDEVRLSWGGDSPFVNESVRKKAQETSLSRYGVSHFVNTQKLKARLKDPKVQEKRFLTLKKRGLLSKSNVEIECGDKIEELFGHVERHVFVNSWSIDIHILSLNVYVQFDGDYWHGLDRNIDDIRTSESRIDRVIIKTWERDREQEQWFLKNAKKLIRIREIQYKNATNKLEFLHKVILNESEKENTLTK